MKNKIVSLLLIAAMLFSLCSVFMTGCAEEEVDFEGILNEAASTLVMWVVTEEGTDDEQAEAVAKQMATITKSKYKTDLVIRYLTMEEYYTELEKAIKENERLAQVTLLAEEIASATKKADSDTTGQFKKGTITEEQRDDYYFTFISELLKMVDAALTGITTDEDLQGLEITDEELEELLIEMVGQLVDHDMADAFVDNRDTLIAVMENELANPPDASEVGKKHIYMTQTAIDLANRLFDLIAEHKDSFAEEDDEEGEEDADAETEDEKEEEDTLIRDENGNMVVDQTVYPEAEAHQVDILYISGYDKYQEYIENEWLVALDTELNGNSKVIKSYVSTSLLNAVKQDNETFAIPNNNIIGEYTYMLIDKTLFDKYYYTGMVEDVHGVSDVADFVEDIAKYEPDVLPIDGDVNYCMSLIAHYWSINPENMSVDPSVFSVLGHAYAPDEIITRGSTAMTFDNLLADDNYVEALMNLKEFEYAGYFGTPAEGQKSAISFVTGDASMVEEYEKDHYVVVVDYPKAADEDIYENMFGICSYSEYPERSMQVLTLLNTDSEFRNLLQYGIEGVNYELSDEGVAVMTAANAYHMDIAKTGNQFLAHVPEGMNVDVWEFAKQQNRESQVDPLLGFAFLPQLESDEELFLSEEAAADDEVFYYHEVMDTELIKYINDLSAQVWAEIQACTDVDTLEKTINTWYRKVAQDEKIKSAMVYDVVLDKLDEKTGEVAAPDEDDSTTSTTAKKATVKQTVTQTKIRIIKQEITAEGQTGVVETEQKYFLVTKTYNPYQIYYRWMQAYNYLPATMVPAQ